ncbi:MAG: AAA family ATPase, partial [Candidatus Omnitrophota bacterium]
MNMKKLPIGVSDFKKIIEDDYYYVDKTLFIKEVIDSGDTILVIPRPRRFGKTLNISMLRYFYDCCPVAWDNESQSHGNYKYLFDSLTISGTGQEYLDKMGQYPVIFFTFKNIKEKSWEACRLKIKKLIQKEYARHNYLLASPKLMDHERDYFQKII